MLNILQMRDGVKLIITNHFSRQLEQRFSGGDNKEKVLKNLVNWIDHGFVITQKPRHLNVTAILNNNFRESIYIYNPQEHMVVVLEKNNHTGEFNVLKTIYSSKYCWTETWKNETPCSQRIKWIDFPKNHPVFPIIKQKKMA